MNFVFDSDVNSFGFETLRRLLRNNGTCRCQSIDVANTIVNSERVNAYRVARVPVNCGNCTWNHVPLKRGSQLA
jgi:hypothetical protein